MNQNVKNALLFVVIIVSVVLLWNFITTTRAGTKEIAFSDFLDRVEKNQVSEVLIRGDEVYGRSPEPATDHPLAARPFDFVTYSPGYDDLVYVLREHKVKIKAEQAVAGLDAGPRSCRGCRSCCWSVMWYFFYRQMQAGGNKAMAFGKSRRTPADSPPEESDHLQGRRRRRGGQGGARRRSSSSSATRRSSRSSAARSPRACC